MTINERIVITEKKINFYKNRLNTEELVKTQRKHILVKIRSLVSQLKLLRKLSLWSIDS